MSKNIIHLTTPKLNQAKHCDLCGRIFAFGPVRSTVCGTCLQDVARWGQASQKQSKQSKQSKLNLKRKVSVKENAPVSAAPTAKPQVMKEVKKEQTMEEEFFALIADLSTVKDKEESPPPPPTASVSAPVKSIPPPKSSSVSTTVPLKLETMPPPSSMQSISAPVQTAKKVKTSKKRKSEGDPSTSSTSRKKQKRADAKAKPAKDALYTAQILRKRVGLLNTPANHNMLGRLVPPSFRQAVWNIVQAREQDHTEYINASALYTALQNAAATRSFQFRGRHSLISQHDIGIPGPRLRAEAVARELKKLPGLSFTQLKSRGEDPDGGMCLIYRCTCGKSATSSGFKPDCKGALRIQVQHDLTHPLRHLGVNGLRVEVVVNHP